MADLQYGMLGEWYINKNTYNIGNSEDYCGFYMEYEDAIDFYNKTIHKLFTHTHQTFKQLLKWMSLTWETDESLVPKTSK